MTNVEVSALPPKADPLSAGTHVCYRTSVRLRHLLYIDNGQVCTSVLVPSCLRMLVVGGIAVRGGSY
jgi:hypothetical protein